MRSNTTALPPWHRRMVSHFFCWSLAAWPCITPRSSSSGSSPLRPSAMISFKSCLRARNASFSPSLMSFHKSDGTRVKFLSSPTSRLALEPPESPHEAHKGGERLESCKCVDRLSFSHS